jgi:hypothetical protein
MRNLRVFGISDIPITAIKYKRDSAMLKLMGELLKRNVAVESVDVLRKKIITSSIAFSPHCRKVTGK